MSSTKISEKMAINKYTNRYSKQLFRFYGSCTRYTVISQEKNYYQRVKYIFEENERNKVKQSRF